MPVKAGSLLEAASCAFLGGLTFTAANLHDLAIIGNCIAVVLTAWGAKRAATGKPRGRKPKKKTPDNGAN